MDICVIGAGYVGLTSAAVLAELGHRVICVDKDLEKINNLKNGIIPIFEPLLEDLIKKNKTLLTFSHSIEESISKAATLLIAVGTPSNIDGSSDLSFIKSVINEISGHIFSYKTIIIKSTVPPGTNESIYKTILEKGVDPSQFNIVSNPEFLREGSAITDMINADRIVVGLRDGDGYSLSIIKQMYHGLKSPYIITSLTGAEMIKYASNAMLALKISFINELARICDKYLVDIQDVAKGIGADARIGPHFLQAGIGYGGSCFPKDVLSLQFSAKAKNVNTPILEALQEINDTQVNIYIDKLKEMMPDLSHSIITVLGIAFKANTDDTRYSPSVRLMNRLSEIGCEIHAYDPKAVLPMAHNRIIQFNRLEESILDSDCLILATDWEEFLQLDWNDVKSKMKGNILLDARNCLKKNEIEKLGFNYLGIGRP